MRSNPVPNEIAHSRAVFLSLLMIANIYEKPVRADWIRTTNFRSICPVPWRNLAKFGITH